MNNRELNEYAQREVLNIDANVSLLVYDYAHDETLLSIDAERKLVSASTIKTPIMLTALDRVQNGTLKIDQMLPVESKEILEDTEVFDHGEPAYSLEELLTWMIINSDNTATNVLIEWLGMGAVNTYSDSLGLESTVLERKMLDWDALRAGRNNFTSAADQLIIFTKLYHQLILTPALCGLAIRILKQQRDFSSAFRYIADPSLTAAHKTGGLDHLNHDVGIFYLPDRAYYFGCFVTDCMGETEENPLAQKLIGRLSKSVYEFYKGGLQ